MPDARVLELTAEQRRFYEANGYVKVPGVFNASEARELAGWVEEVANFPVSVTTEDKWMQHVEDTVHGPRLTRTEFFVAYHGPLGRLLMAGRVPSLVGSALDEPVFLDKEKINYKYPGGAGYHAHQDAPA